MGTSGGHGPARRPTGLANACAIYATSVEVNSPNASM
jgi:hypothetical protein